MPHLFSQNAARESNFTSCQYCMWDHSFSVSHAILACPIVTPQPRKDESVVATFTSTGGGITGAVNGVAFSLPTIPSSDKPENLVRFSDCSKVSCLNQPCLILSLLRVEVFCRTNELA